MNRTGGQILVDQLVLHGVRHVFCVPGESYLAALDAMHDAAIEITVCRQESGAAMMAEAQGKLTGRPGICFVTRGPGATNASAGVHIARQDSTPMILFVGQIGRDMREREAFQEVDYRAVFGTLAKWATEIDDPARVPELVARAFRVACSGRPGPVVVALPEDMLTEMAEAQDARPYRVDEAAPDPAGLERLLGMLAAARRPLLVAGGSRWDQAAVDGLVGFAERFGLPVAASFRRQMLFPNSHPNYAGDIGVGANPKLVQFARDADLLLLLGARMSEAPSQGYTLLGIPCAAPASGQAIVHVLPSPDELGRVFQPDLSFPVSPAAFLRGVAALRPDAAPDRMAPDSTTPDPTTPDRATPDRAALLAEARAIYRGWSDAPTAVPGPFNLGEVMVALRERMAPDTVVCNGAGNFATWVHRFHRYERHGTQLAPTSGSMGYGLPAGVGAARLDPSRPVLVVAGDGDVLMTGQEFATAVQYALPIVVVVVDNGMYGTIRMHQEREYPGRVVGTALRNPDFAAYARAFGGHGERVERTTDFMAAYERAVASGLPAIIHCVTDPEALTPGRSLSQIRAAASR